jgi:hypothetical protein
VQEDLDRVLVLDRLAIVITAESVVGRYRTGRVKQADKGTIAVELRNIIE